MKRIEFIGMIVICFGISCSKPLVSGRVLPRIDYQSQSFATTSNDAYYAVRKALYRAGYSVAMENLTDGVITTTWVPTTSDSHYVPLFGRRDYAPSGAHHQLEVTIVPEGSTSLVRVGSRMKSLASNLVSSGVEEHKILQFIGDALRKEEPTMTNTGTSE